MNIELRTDNHIQNSDRLITYVREELNQEARPAGLKPVVVNHRGHNVDTAIHGAIDRLKRSLEHVIEKKDNVRPGALELADTDTADIEE